MAASVVSLSGVLCSTSALAIECGKVIDQRSTTGGTLGFMKEKPGRGGKAGFSSPSLAALVYRSSRSSVAATAVATKQKRRSAVLDLDDEGVEEDDDELDDEATGFVDMEDWMKNKPPGFGLKEYDTSVEDRLLAEIEAGKAAKAALANKTKVKKPVKAADKEDTPPQGVEVYVGNLPRKRNVDRDLRAAFRSSQGLLHIRPIVDGNEKTREPMCKGLAFLTFASDREAQDFIRRYNGGDVRFGKAEKRVVCELASVNSPFKKQASQKQGTDAPRLLVRDKTPTTTPPAPATLSSNSTAKPLDTRDALTPETNSNSDHLDDQDDDIDSLDVAEEELIELEQEIWAELEDEDDFEVDRELQDSRDSESPSVSLTVDNTIISDSDSAPERQQEVGHEVYPAENSLVVKDRDEEAEAEAGLQAAETRRGQGFGLTPPAAAAGEKDERIRELESKLKRLEGQLKKRETKGLVVGERTPQSEEKIEALEKRLLARARSEDQEKDSRSVGTTKRVAGAKKVSSKVRSLAKGDPARPKIGASKRLRKKERDIYKGVLSKYSPLEKEVAL